MRVTLINLFLLLSVTDLGPAREGGTTYDYVCAEEKTLQGDKPLLTAEAPRTTSASIYLHIRMPSTRKECLYH